MNNKWINLILSGSLALPAMAGYGTDDTQIVFSFAGAGNNVRLYSEVLAQIERDLPGKPLAGLVDRMAGHSTGGMLATFLTLPRQAGGTPMTAGESLEHMRVHGPKLYTTISRGLTQPDKARVQAEVRGHMGNALGAQGALRISEMPAKAEVLLHEVDGKERRPVSVTAAAARSGLVPDATLTELLSAALSVEMLAGHTPLSGSAETKATRTFVDSGSILKTDPTPGLIEAAKVSGKPARIFAFEGGYGFEPATLAAAARTREAEDLLARGSTAKEVEASHGRVRVYLFDSAKPEHQLCDTCGNIARTGPAMCGDHQPNMERLIGARVGPARTKIANNQDLAFMPLRLLALNILTGLADSDINRELQLVAEHQMIGPVGGRTPSYAKLLAVLTEAAATSEGEHKALATVPKLDSTVADSARAGEEVKH